MATSCWIGDRIGAERPFDVDLDVEPLQPLAGPPPRAAPQSTSPNLRGWRPSVHVLGHRHGRDEIDFLIDRPDPERLRFAGRADVDRAPVEPDLALVAPERAGHDLDQGRLPGPVLAHEGVDLAGLDLEIHALERPDAGKGLRDAQHFDARSHDRRSGVVPKSR